MDFPILRIELEGIRSTITHALGNRNEDINKLIAKAFEEKLTQEWVQQQIGIAVDDCIRSAIKTLSSNYGLQSVIQEAIVEKLQEAIRSQQ